MSCPNFKKVNARNYYVVGDETTYYDEEKDEDVPCLKDSDDYDLDVEFAQELAKEKGFTPMNYSKHGAYQKSMDASCFAYKSAWYCFGDKSAHLDLNNIEFTQELYVHSGYYTGMNYDWDLYVDGNFGYSIRLSEYDDLESFIEDITDAWQMEASDSWNAGMAKIQKKNFKKWIEKMVAKLSDEADNLCEEVCEETYVCGGIFSNGEAIYYKKDSLKGIANNVEAA